LHRHAGSVDQLISQYAMPLTGIGRRTAGVMAAEDVAAGVSTAGGAHAHATADIAAIATTQRTRRLAR